MGLTLMLEGEVTCMPICHVFIGQFVQNLKRGNTQTGE